MKRPLIGGTLSVDSYSLPNLLVKYKKRRTADL